MGECKLLYEVDNINVDDKVTASVDGVNGFPKKIAIVGLGKRRDFMNPSSDQELCETLEIARNAVMLINRKMLKIVGISLPYITI